MNTRVWVHCNDCRARLELPSLLTGPSYAAARGWVRIAPGVDLCPSCIMFLVVGALALAAAVMG